MLVHFWGVRGSLSCPSIDYMKFGGNTSCVSLRVDDHLLIFDAGTGILSLGQNLLKDRYSSITLFFSHTHWDHINGFPFFLSLLPHTTILEVFAGHLEKNWGIREVLDGQLQSPFFPVPLHVLHANVIYHDFKPGTSLQHKNSHLSIRTVMLNHPGGSVGYRVDYKGSSLCYITDTEHVVGLPDRNILSLIQGADLLIYDSTYTEEEFLSKKGWGHSTWEEGVRLSRMAGVKKMVIFHHDFSHTDVIMDDIEQKASRTWDGIIVAREGMEIDILAL